MAIIEVGLTLDDALKANQPIPANKYRATLVGWFKDKQGNVKQRTKDNTKWIFKPTFKVLHEDPTINGRQLIFNAVVGSFSYSELGEALPQIFVGTGIDDQVGLGSEVWLDVSVGTNQNTGKPQNQIDHIHHIAAQ